jgi:hypothetical protein
MAKFDASVARKTTGGMLVRREVAQEPEEQKSAFYREYFDLESGEPIALDRITTRIRKRFSEMDKLSVLVMLDLYFVHQNWSSFYNREDSFKSYVMEDLKISRVYAYGVLNAVSLAEEYFRQKGEMCNTGVTHFERDIAEVLDRIGIKKLRMLSKVKDDGLKYGILDRLVDGEQLSSDKINKLIAERKIIPEKQPALEAKVNGKTVSVDGIDILTFKESDDGLKNAILMAVTAYYRKNAKGKA